MSDALHVCIVAHDVGPVGGMESQLLQLVSGLLDRGHRVTVVSRTCEAPAHPRLRHRVVRGPRRPFAVWFPWFALAAAPRIPRDADVVHTTGALVARRAGVSTVHLLHAALGDSRVRRVRRDTLAYRINAALSGWMSRAFERRAYRAGVTGELVAVSAGVAREIAAHFPAMAGRTTVIRNGVDLGAFRPDPAARAALRSRLGLGSDALLAVFAGGDWTRKGLDQAIGALAEAPGWHLAVAGAGDVAAAQAHARASGVGDRVHFLGLVRGVAAVHAAADAFVLPSAYETFSLVTYEAAASGVPLLVTRVSGVEDVLADGVNGWFIRRDAHDIAARLRTLAADPALRARMGAAARAATRDVTWEAMVDAYCHLYRRLAARGSDAGVAATPAPEPRAAPVRAARLDTTPVPEPRLAATPPLEPGRAVASPAQERLAAVPGAEPRLAARMTRQRLAAAPAADPRLSEEPARG